jgi:hypothetical protein
MPLTRDSGTAVAWSPETNCMSHDLKAIVGGGNKAKFSHYRDGNFFYVVNVQDRAYSFPIPIEDAKGTTLYAEFKAITLMRWIRKAIEDKAFQPLKQ